MINQERLNQSTFDAYLSKWGYEKNKEDKEIITLFVDFMEQVFPDRLFNKDACGEEPCIFHRDDMRKAYFFGYYAGKRGDAMTQKTIKPLSKSKIDGLDNIEPLTLHPDIMTPSELRKFNKINEIAEKVNIIIRILESK